MATKIFFFQKIKIKNKKYGWTRITPKVSVSSSTYYFCSPAENTLSRNIREMQPASSMCKKDWLVKLCQQLEVIKVMYWNCRYQLGWRPNDGNEDACRKITLSMCWGPSVTKFSQQDCQGEKTCTRGRALAPCLLLFTKVKYVAFSIAKAKIKMRTDLCWEVEDLWLGYWNDHSLGQRLVRFILYIFFKMLTHIAFGSKP